MGGGRASPAVVAMGRYEVVVRTFRMRSTVQRKQSTPDLVCWERSGPIADGDPKVLEGLDPGQHRGSVFCSGICHSLDLAPVDLAVE